MSNSVRDFYNGQVTREWERAETPLYRIEFANALHLIHRHFPASGAMCDIGGGPGRYAIELLRRGFDVTLVDLSEALIEFAQAEATRVGLNLERALQADARELGMLESGTFNAALLMGPMYHVVEAADRLRVLSELHRILKDEGVAIVTYLNSWGLLKTGIADVPERFRNMQFLRSMMG